MCLCRVGKKGIGGLAGVGKARNVFEELGEVGIVESETDKEEGTHPRQRAEGF